MGTAPKTGVALACWPNTGAELGLAPKAGVLAAGAEKGDGEPKEEPKAGADCEAPKAPVEGACPAPNAEEEGAELKTNGEDVEVGAGGGAQRSRGTLTQSFT